MPAKILLILLFPFILSAQTDKERIYTLEKIVQEQRIEIAVQKTTIERIEEARKLQALEYERRLDILNGERGRSEDDRKLFELKTDATSREQKQITKTDNLEAKLVEMIKTSDNNIAGLTSWKDNFQGQQTTAMIGISAAASFIVGLITFIVSSFVTRKRIVETKK